MSDKTDKKRLDCYWSVTSGERYPALIDRFTREVIEPRREAIRQVLRRGIGTGELRADLDVEVTLCLILGAIAQRVRAPGLGPTPEDFPERTVDAVLAGILPR